MALHLSLHVARLDFWFWQSAPVVCLSSCALQSSAGRNFSQLCFESVGVLVDLFEFQSNRFALLWFGLVVKALGAAGVGGEEFNLVCASTGKLMKVLAPTTPTKLLTNFFIVFFVIKNIHRYLSVEILKNKRSPNPAKIVRELLAIIRVESYCCTRCSNLVFCFF